MRIGLAVILLAAALAARGDALDVRAAQVDDLTGASRVVTNVTFDAEGAFNAISNRADALIKAVAPTSGDYGTVSNRAMSALQSHQSLAPSTNYTDAALGAFAATGAVARATVYGTATRWTDATGCVWEVVTNPPWTQVEGPPGYSITWYDDSNAFIISTYYDGEGWYVSRGDHYPEKAASEHSATNAACYTNPVGGGATIDYVRYVRQAPGLTNLVGRVALTNDLPDVSGYTTPADVAAAIREQSLGGIYDSELGVWWTPIMQNGALRYETNAVQNAADALAAVSNVVASGGLASVDAVDAKISTNNAAFVSAVLAVPLTGADAGDLAEISEYGGYGTIGAAILALIAGLAALKRRVTSAETALEQKANAADLPYRLVEPGKWEFSDGGSHVVSGPELQSDDMWSYGLDGVLYSDGFESESDALSALSIVFRGETIITATRASLPGHLIDRAGNKVVVTGDTTLTLPAANPGYLRDFLVRLEISGSTVPTITFAAPTGETITYETDGDEFPVPDEVGTWSYSFTENCVAHKFAVSLKKVNTVAAPQAQGGS